jgi:hypothetical protein
MRRAPLALVLVPLLACLQQVSTGTGTTDPTAGTGATPSSSGPGGAVPTGSACTDDPQTGVTLCEETSLCPGVAFDPGALPNCGFQLHAGSVIDLECLCGTALCPIGVPQTCAQAAELLASQSSVVVCQQASNGNCIELAAPVADAGASSSCDKQCETECAGEPGCIQLCGC